MTARDWASSDYSRIYHSVVSDDPKFEEVYDDDARLAWYVRLLVAADGTWPAATPLPYGIPPEVLEHLTERRVITRVRGGHYRIKGHEAERQGSRAGRAAGGKARVANAERDELGRLLPSQQSSSNATSNAEPESQQPPATPATGQVDSQHRNAGQPGQPAKTRREETRRDEKMSTSTPRTREELGAEVPPESSHVNGWTRVGEVDWQQALTEEERIEWSAFGDEWANVQRAWLARGFRRPPMGSGDDEPGESQRALLWEVLDARPDDLPAWIAGAPEGVPASQVVAYVLARWHAIQADVAATTEAEDAAWAAVKAEDREQAARRMAELEAQL